MLPYLKRICRPTQTKGKEVWQCPRGIEHDVELARLQESIPIRRIPAESSRDGIAESQYAKGIEEAENSSY